MKPCPYCGSRELETYDDAKTDARGHRGNLVVALVASGYILPDVAEYMGIGIEEAGRLLFSTRAKLAKMMEERRGGER